MVYDDTDDEAWAEEDPDDIADDDASETISCPECGQLVYEDAVQCPSCGNYISPTSGIWSHRPIWWIALGGLGILAVIWWLMAL